MPSHDNWQQRLKAWFSNNTDKGRRKHIKSELFHIQMKPHRRLQAVEVYSRKYYESRVQAGVKSEIADRHLTKKEVLAVIKRRTHDTFEAELEEVKKEIYDEVEASKGNKRDGDEETEVARTPEEYTM